MTVIDAQELTKVYPSRMSKGGIVALDGVTFSVQQAEVFGLLGPNGAGKTTFLKVALGVTRATAGSVTIDGLPPRDPRSRQKIGYLPENHRFPGHLTGLGLLEFTGRLYGMLSSETDSRAEQLLALVGMTRWANVKIKSYSKGMAQRIGLAQALLPDPEVLLLDEPTDGVDPVGKVEIREVLQRVRSEGKSILLNSHLLSEVEAVADRVAILSRGKVVRVSTVDALTSRASQYEVEADIGSHVIKIPPDVGKIISVSTKGLIAELTHQENINHIIDELRLKRITIRSVRPLKITLEQSFLETITATPEEAK